MPINSMKQETLSMISQPDCSRFSWLPEFAALVLPAAPAALAISEGAGVAATVALGVAAVLHGLAWYGGRRDAGPKAWFDFLGVPIGSYGIAASKELMRYAATRELAYGETRESALREAERFRADISLVSSISGLEVAVPGFFGA
jgi:hypothetical protein